MATVIGVRFKKAGKVYYFDPCEVWPRPGDSVVVEDGAGAWSSAKSSPARARWPTSRSSRR